MKCISLVLLATVRDALGLLLFCLCTASCRLYIPCTLELFQRDTEWSPSQLVAKVCISIIVVMHDTAHWSPGAVVWEKEHFLHGGGWRLTNGGWRSTDACLVNLVSVCPRGLGCVPVHACWRRGGGDGGWQSVRMGGSDNKGDGLASQPHRYRMPGQPLLNRHQVGGVSRSPDGLFAQQERDPIRGRPAVRGKRTYGGLPGHRVEKQGTWASRTQKHSEAGYGRPVDRGGWTAKTVKRPRQQPAHPQYANYWAPLTRKWHTMPHSAQPQHTNYWAPRTRKRHQQEHRPQRPTESSNPTQHAKGRTGDCPGPRKGATTRRNVTQGAGPGLRYRQRIGLGLRGGSVCCPAHGVCSARASPPIRTHAASPQNASTCAAPSARPLPPVCRRLSRP